MSTDLELEVDFLKGESFLGKSGSKKIILRQKSFEKVSRIFKTRLKKFLSCAIIVTEQCKEVRYYVKKKDRKRAERVEKYS